jgi:DNA-binding Lrp family transcriptional regulator
MKKPRLDPIDLKILEILQANGRITNVELAKQVEISAPPCLRRVRALEEAGFIQGYRARVDANMLGLGVTVFAMVGLESQAEVDLQAFESRVSEWPEVLECHMLNGEIDFILKCVSTDLESFQEFLTQKLTSAPNVANVRTSLTIRRSKGDVSLPLSHIK